MQILISYLVGGFTAVVSGLLKQWRYWLTVRACETAPSGIVCWSGVLCRKNATLSLKRNVTRLTLSYFPNSHGTV